MPKHASRRTFLTARPSAWSLLVPVVALVAGLLFSASSSSASGGSLRYDSDSVADRVRAGTRANQLRAQRLDLLQTEVDALTKTMAARNVEVDALKSQGDELAGAAGRVAVTGPGIEVTLNDSPLRGDEIPRGFTVDDIVVHQQDVQAVVNALWSAGAEAMMLMDQRVISTSAVRCVGNTLILKGRVYSPPYVITAIGDGEAMKTALDRDKKVRIYREYVSAVGLGYQVRLRDEVNLPAYSGSIAAQHAQAQR